MQPHVSDTALLKRPITHQTLQSYGFRFYMTSRSPSKLGFKLLGNSTVDDRLDITAFPGDLVVAKRRDLLFGPRLRNEAKHQHSDEPQ